VRRVPAVRGDVNEECWGVRYCRASSLLVFAFALVGCSSHAGAQRAQATDASVPAPTPDPGPSSTAWWCTYAKSARVGDPAALCLPFAQARLAFRARASTLSTDVGAALANFGEAQDAVVVLLMANRDADARAYLNRIERCCSFFAEGFAAGPSRPLQPGDRLFIQGRLAESMQWFVDSMAANEEMKAGARRMAQGDEDGAIAALERPSGSEGGEVDTAHNPGTKLLMLGDLYADRRRWNDAFERWSRSARTDLGFPKEVGLYRYGLSALEMMYYYRAHMGDG